MGKGKLKHIVHLPKAALNASDHHEFGDKFVFPETTALSSSASQPLDHVPDQGAPHVPTDVPPSGLPSDATDNMSDTAVTQLHAHVDWLIS
jgi:hypothetical protein